MSKRNANTPLPNIGATEWGATLNNYLRAQEYNQKEIKDELANTIAAKNSTVAVNLSSGVVDTILEGNIHPGLYDGDDRMSHGAELDTNKDYHYRGRVVFIAEQNYAKEYSDAVDGENILDLSRYINSEEDNDGWVIYLCHDSQGYHMSWVSMNTNNVSGNNSSIILDPNYILLGLILKINGNYYWYEKTMISSDSITTKSWHLTQSFANLNTYFNCQNGYLLPYTAEGVNAILLVQGYGLAPFSNSTDTNPNTNSHKNIIQQTLATYTGTPDYNFKVLSKLGSNITLNDADYKYTFNSNLLYRLCATGIQLDDTPVLLLQEATSGDTFTPTNSENIDFINMILPFVDCVELYRFDGGSPTTLKAAPGNGISSVNANGLNPHVTTLIRDGNGVCFGSTKDNNFTFKTEDAAAGYQLSGKHTIAIPNDTVSDRWMLLNKTVLNTDIYLQAGTGVFNSSAISIQPSTINISTSTNKIELTNNALKITAPKFQVHDSINSLVDIFSVEQTKPSSINTTVLIKPLSNNKNYHISLTAGITPTINIGNQDSNHQITLTAGEQPMIKVGGGAELRHDGLYLPSGGSGIEIGDVNQGLITINNLKKGSVELRYPGAVSQDSVSFNAYGLSSTNRELRAIIYSTDADIDDYYRDTYFWVQIEDGTCVKLKADLWDSENNTISDNQWADVYLDDQKWVSHEKNWKFKIIHVKQEIHFILKPDSDDRSVVDDCLWNLLPVTERIMDIQTNESRMDINTNSSSGQIDVYTNQGLVQINGNDVNGKVTIQKNNGDITIQHQSNKNGVTIQNGNVSLGERSGIKFSNYSQVSQYLKIKTSNQDIVTPEVLKFYNDNATIFGGLNNDLLFIPPFPTSGIPQNSTEKVYGYHRSDYYSNATSYAVPPINSIPYSKFYTLHSNEIQYVQLLPCGSHPYVHRWVKISIAASSHPNNSPCLQTFWALTGARNRYFFKSEDVTKFYMQYNSEDNKSTSCNGYFEIDTRPTEWQIITPLEKNLFYNIKLEYADRNEVTGSNDFLKACFFSTADIIIYHKLQGGGTSTSDTGVSVKISNQAWDNKTTWGVEAPYNYIVQRGTGMSWD